MLHPMAATRVKSTKKAAGTRCARLGQPTLYGVPMGKIVGLRLPDGLREYLERVATERNSSISHVARRLIEVAIDHGGVPDD